MIPALAAGSGALGSWLPAVIGGIASLLTGGGLVALFKARPEGSKILVDTAQGAVIVQTGVMTSLRESLKSAEDKNDATEKRLSGALREIADLRSHITEVNELRGKVRTLEHDNEQLASENARLRARQSQLELENEDLAGRVAELERRQPGA